MLINLVTCPSDCDQKPLVFLFKAEFISPHLWLDLYRHVKIFLLQCLVQHILFIFFQVNKIVDSKNQSIANYTMGCNTNCNYEKDTTGCCNSNLCNGDLSLLNSGQYVKYNFLMSVLCIAISLFRLDIYF